MGAGGWGPPLPGPRGLVSGDPDAFTARIHAAWTAFLDVAEAADLDRRTRLPGWRGREVVAHLGSWDTTPLSAVLTSARAGGTGPVPDADAANAATVAAHGSKPRAELLAALRRSAAAATNFPTSAVASELGLAPSVSAVGVLPVLTLLHAGAYELAVHALDLHSAGAPAPPEDLLHAGLASLVDVTGALAWHAGLHTDLAAVAPGGGWRMAVTADGWTVHELGPGPVSGTAVQASAGDLLDVSAGRAQAPVLLARRRLVVHNLPGLLRLAPLVDSAPGIPGSGTLRVAARALGAVGGVGTGVGAALGRLSRLSGRRPG